MTLKETFKTVEGLAMLIAFGMIILSGFKIWAWLGLGAYVVTNLSGGIKKVVSAIKYIGKLLGI